MKPFQFGERTNAEKYNSVHIELPGDEDIG